MVGDTNRFPCLSAKAAEPRALIKPMLMCIREVAPISSNIHWQHVERCYRHIDEFYDAVYRSGLFLSDDDADVAKASVDKFILHYNALTIISAERGKPRYNFTTKLHTVYHMSISTQRLSPKCSWAYAFEDFMGQIIKVGKACSHGAAGHMVPMKIMEHYMLILSIFLHGKLDPRL